MIEEFELALTDNKDLEQVAKQLADRAESDRHKRLREIQHDLDFCKLIRAGLTEDAETGPFMIARAYVRMYRRKHYPGGQYKLAAELMQEADNEEGAETDDNNTEKQASITGSATERTGGRGEKQISARIPPKPSGQSEEME